MERGGEGGGGIQRGVLPAGLKAGVEFVVVAPQHHY